MSSRLSLQKHHHRSEHWIVVRGTVRVTVNELVKLVHEHPHRGRLPAILSGKVALSRMMLFPMISTPAPFFTSKKKHRLRYLARKRPFVAPELFEGRAVQVDESLEAMCEIPGRMRRWRG
jgi:hypothetical protein